MPTYYIMKRNPAAIGGCDKVGTASSLRQARSMAVGLDDKANGKRLNYTKILTEPEYNEWLDNTLSMAPGGRR